MHTGPMKPADMAGALKKFGWKVDSDARITQALKDFQRGWNLGNPLPITGTNGPETRYAIRLSLREHNAGRADASPHFSWLETKCKCGGRYNGCAIIRVHRGLFVGLETYRKVAGPTSLVSVYRCAAHNQKVGGATSSQHVYGAAADLNPKLKTAKVESMRAFAGIGFQAASGLVRHVDRRDVSGNNTTCGTKDRPTKWKYGA